MKHLRQFLMPMLLCLLALAGALSASALQAGVVTIQSGAVRVELLSDTVIRVEEKVNGGFEDRTTLVAETISPASRRRSARRAPSSRQRPQTIR